MTIKAGDSYWENNSSGTQAERRVCRADGLQNKARDPVWGGKLGCGLVDWLKLRQQRALLALKLLPLLCLGRGSNV